MPNRLLALLLVAALAVACTGPSNPVPPPSTAPPPATATEPPPSTTTSQPVPPPPVVTPPATTPPPAPPPPVVVPPPPTPPVTLPPVIHCPDGSVIPAGEKCPTPPPPPPPSLPPAKPPCTGTPVPTGKVNQIGLRTCTFCDGHVDVCPSAPAPKPAPSGPPSADPACAGVSTAAYGADVRMTFPLNKDPGKPDDGTLAYPGIQQIYAFQERDGSWNAVADLTALEYGPNGYLSKDEIGRRVQPKPGDVELSCVNPYSAGGFDDGGIHDHRYKGTPIMQTRIVYPVNNGGFDDAWLAGQPKVVDSINRFIQRVRGLSDKTGHPRAAHPFARQDNSCLAYPCGK